MYFSKAGILTISGLLILSSIAIASAEDGVQIVSELKNPIQHINTITFINDKSDKKVIMKANDKKMINIQTNESNFVLQPSDGENYITKSSLSNILGWKENSINSWNKSIIVAWEGNKILSDTSVIAWWKWNSISWNSANSTILWWQWNRILQNSKSSTIIWWYNNLIKWNYSTTAWTNNKVEWDHSVALWSWSIVNGDNSFLRNDWNSSKAINQDDVFAILWQQWLVVNNTKAAPGAQLTIWWSLNVSPNTAKDSNIKCEWGEWKGILKTLKNNANDGQYCFCVCNGFSRDSVFWDWSCTQECKLEDINPRCGNIAKLEGDIYVWSCEKWEVISQSYFMETNKEGHSRLFRFCQNTAWVTTWCYYEF